MGYGPYAEGGTTIPAFKWDSFQYPFLRPFICEEKGTEILKFYLELFWI